MQGLTVNDRGHDAYMQRWPACSSSGAGLYVRGRRGLVTGLAALLLAVAVEGDASAQQAVSRFDIEIQPVSEALYWFSWYSGVGIVLPPGFPRRNILQRLHGDYTHQEALRLLLRGTDHQARFVSPTLVQIVPSFAPLLRTGPARAEPAASAGRLGVCDLESELARLPLPVVAASRRRPIRIDAFD